MLEVGLKHTSTLVVNDDVTAVKIGSGDVLIGEGSHLRFVVDRERFCPRFENIK